MIKQISTYGAALLTVMVVIRATTLEDTSDLSSLYQRGEDQLHVENNLVLRNGYNIFNVPGANLLAVIGKINDTQVSPDEKVFAEPEVPVANAAYIEPGDFANLLPQAEEIERFEETLISEESGLSLDGDNTINSNLSLLFPRQRIQPRPNDQGSPE